MNVQELCAAVEDFGTGIKASEQLCDRGGRLTPILCMFYAMWSAFAIRTQLGICPADENETSTNGAGKGSQCVAHGSLPRFEIVRDAAQKFIAAASSDNRAGMSSALEEMEVFTLCPDLETQLARMELLARSVTGRAQLIFLVQLSRFAAELGNYQQASKYAMEARALDPCSWELYSLCVVEGLIALNAGKDREAIQYLDKSISACLKDEYTLLSCGVRVPNLALAEKLLHSGERVEIVRHLLQCKDVWLFLQPRIDEWISTIEDGEMPDFHGMGVSRVFNFAYNLQFHWMRALSVEEGAVSATPKSPAEAITARERLRAEYKRNMSAAIKRKLENL